MTAETFAVIFRGRIVDGADMAAVRANLAKLFKADAARIEKMFSGQAVIIKKGLDAGDAEKYWAALAKAGAVAEVVAMPATTGSSPALQSSPPAPSPPAAQASPRGAAVPPPPSTVPEAFANREAPPAALNASVAEPGVTLIDYTPPPSPTIATEHLSMAEAGATLVEVEPVPEPDYDLSGLTLDRPGVTLVEPRHVPEPDYDLSGMALVEEKTE
ncbi:MAG: hypothetical protein WD928_17305 [Gammaproteobacteria bacterium]